MCVCVCLRGYFWEYLIARSGVATLRRIAGLLRISWLLRIAGLLGIARLGRVARLLGIAWLLRISRLSSGVTGLLRIARLLGIAGLSGGVTGLGGVARLLRIARLSRVARLGDRVTGLSNWIAGLSGRVARHGLRGRHWGRSASSGRTAKVQGGNTNLDITLVLTSELEGQPAIPLETLHQVGDGQLGNTDCVISRDGIVIEHGEFDHVLILRVDGHLKGLIPDRMESLVDVLSLVNLGKPVVLITDLNRAVRIRLSTDIGSLDILGFVNGDSDHLGRHLLKTIRE